MILIADSGSTKTSWAQISKNKTNVFDTSGINPIVQDEDSIKNILNKELIPRVINASNIVCVYFYGAGCAGSGIDKIQSLLSSVFSCKIHVESDLKGSAIAAFEDQEGIIGLLGTGSNSAHIKNGKIVDQVNSMGYILGDEGSGAYLGKKLLSDFFKRNMPLTISQKLEHDLNITKESVLENVYYSNKPNTYLAGFVPFIAENIKNKYCKTLVEEGFQSFFDRNLLKYTGYILFNLAFTGSIAYVFRDILKEVAQKNGFNNITIIRSPIDRLIKYYASKL